jgi:uncharacterized SAM-binding protein YcdF (DUF218 family)
LTELWPKIAGQVLTPPGLILVIATIGYLIRIRWKWTGGFIIAGSLALLLILSVPFIAKQLIAPLENQFLPLSTLTPEAAVKQADVIVVLGGGRYAGAPEYDGDTVGQYTLERLRYAAKLSRQTGLPLLVSGGRPYAEESSEATLMRQTLEQDFGIRPRWVESDSTNTLENAQFTKKILQEAGVRRIFLVTHAWHMPRAVWAFTGTGLSVTAAPTGFTTLTPGDRRLLGYLPGTRGLTVSALALRERIGLAWYRSRSEAASAMSDSPAPATSTTR